MEGTILVLDRIVLIFLRLAMVSMYFARVVIEGRELSCFCSL